MSHAKGTQLNSKAEKPNLEAAIEFSMSYIATVLKPAIRIARSSMFRDDKVQRVRR